MEKLIKVLGNLFYLSVDELYIKIIFCGLKISVQKPSIIKARRQNPYYYYVKNNVDITTVPAATGEFRDFQLANLALLIDFDAICKQNNIHYWIDFGTLLGAVRHKGFIPWDDDIDLGIFRDDYNKITDIVNNNTVNPDLCIVYNKKGTFIRVSHKKCNHLFLDLFPVDKYGEVIPVEEQLERSQQIKSLITPIHRDLQYETKQEERRELLAKIRTEQILINELPQDETKMQYVWGIDFNHSWKNWFTNYDEYFPFKTIMFEGYEFPCVNNPDKYLQKVYGNYMAYPKKMRVGHNIFKKRSSEEIESIKTIIKEKGLDK